MNVETGGTVKREMLWDRTLRGQLVDKAREEIVASGLATAEQMRTEPLLTVRPSPGLPNDAPDEVWVDYVFRWERVGR